MKNRSIVINPSRLRTEKTGSTVAILVAGDMYVRNGTTFLIKRGHAFCYERGTLGIKLHAKTETISERERDELLEKGAQLWDVDAREGINVVDPKKYLPKRVKNQQKQSG